VSRNLGHQLEAHDSPAGWLAGWAGGHAWHGTVPAMQPGGHSPSPAAFRTEITGPTAGQAGPQLGPAITADFPEVLAALAKLAEG